MAGETAELGADTIIKRFKQVAFMGKEAGPDYEHVAGLKLHAFTGETGGGEGVMTDHKEDATVDVLKGRCHQYAVVNVKDYTKKTPGEQRQWTFLARGYCIAHKCDNLTKNVVSGLALNVKLKRYFASKSLMMAGRYCSGKQWCWSIHKCVGIPGPMVTDLNLHKDFVVWLEARERWDDKKLLMALGPQVGDRFWALFHNGAQIYAIRESIIKFCEERKDFSRGIGKDENNLTKTIRGVGGLLLPNGKFKFQQQIRVMAEARCVAAWQFCAFAPMLLIAARMVSINPAAEFCKGMHTFFRKVADDKAYATQMITMQPDKKPLTFTTGTDFVLDQELSETQRIAYARLCLPMSTNKLTVELLQLTAAHMLKCQINMSPDLIFNQANRRQVRKFNAKRADNLMAEQFFATWDNFKCRFARNGNDLRTNGRVTWNLNDVTTWLQDKSPEEQDRLIKLVSSVKFRAVVMQREADRKAAEKEVQKEQQVPLPPFVSSRERER
jgi:hypothetical protein